MSSNLPPGVTDSMILGNRPEDIAWEYVHDRIDDDSNSEGLDPEDALFIWENGVELYRATRRQIKRR